MYSLNDGASVERVSDSRTTRDAQGADHVANTGDVILTGGNGKVAVVPADVFDDVFTEQEDSQNDSPEPSSETPESSSSPDAPDAPTGGPATA
jgi:hypothetical protein